MKYKALLWCICIYLCLVPYSVNAAENKAAAPKVIASIKPLHSLVAAIMDGSAAPVLLVDGLSSPHGYQIKPSQMKILHQADIIFYISPELETFLMRPLNTLPDAAQKIVLINTPGLSVFNLRHSALWETYQKQGLKHKPEQEQKHDDDDGKSTHQDKGAHSRHHNHHRHSQDTHIWLDIENSKIIARQISHILQERYPENAPLYQANEKVLIEKLDALNDKLTEKLTPVKDSAFIVFHDAYQYFDRAYDLSAAGSITLEPDQEPGAKRIAEIRETIKSRDIRCVFAEPQFNSRLAQTITEGTAAKISTLDPLGSDIDKGPSLYFLLLEQLATKIRSCLES